MKTYAGLGKLNTWGLKNTLRLNSKFTLNIFFLCLMAIGFYSCEENMWLKSEKKLRNNLEGTWNKLFVTANVSSIETWTFKDGVILIVGTEKKDNGIDDGYTDLVTNDKLDTLMLDAGNFSVDAKIDNSYIKLYNLEETVIESAKQGLNGKWTIVDIDSDILYIAADNGSAIIQREFQKIPM